MWLTPLSIAIEFALRPDNMFWTIFDLNDSEYFIVDSVHPRDGSKTLPSVFRKRRQLR